MLWEAAEETVGETEEAAAEEAATEEIYGAEYDLSHELLAGVYL